MKRQKQGTEMPGVKSRKYCHILSRKDNVFSRVCQSNGDRDPRVTGVGQTCLLGDPCTPDLLASMLLASD